MWFKNLLCFSLADDGSLAPGSLEAELAKHPLRPCTAMSLQSLGWVPPGDDARLVLDHDRHLMIALGSESKLLPSSVVKDEAKARALAFEQQRGFKPGRKMLRDIQEQVAAELLPRAFVKRGATRAWIDPVARRLIVDAASANRAETVVEQLREALGELQAIPLQADPSPAITLTGWLAAGAAPAPFVIGEECELTAPDAGKAVVRYLRHPLEANRLKAHLDQGMKVTRLALIWRDQIAFLLTDPLEIKRVVFLEMDAERAGSANAEGQDTDFALMSGLLSGLLDDLLRALGAESGPKRRTVG